MVVTLCLLTFRQKNIRQNNPFRFAVCLASFSLKIRAHNNWGRGIAWRLVNIIWIPLKWSSKARAALTQSVHVSPFVVGRFYLTCRHRIWWAILPKWRVGSWRKAGTTFPANENLSFRVSTHRRVGGWHNNRKFFKSLSRCTRYPSQKRVLICNFKPPHKSPVVCCLFNQLALNSFLRFVGSAVESLQKKRRFYDH